VAFILSHLADALRTAVASADPVTRPSFTATRDAIHVLGVHTADVDSGLLPSMGSVGDCFDNALMESFWSRMQVELLDRQRWRTRVELANAIFEYLEIFHNRHRRHSSLGMLTPVEFEARHQPTTAA
jgi:transposase InsO family protein